MGPPPGSATGRAELLDHSRTHLIGAALRWKRFRRWTGPWLTGQCEFCESPFTEGGAPGLISGYSVMGGGPAGQNDYCWICAICFESGRDHFCWTVLDTLGRATRVPDLLESMADLTAWPVDMDAGHAPTSSPGDRTVRRDGRGRDAPAAHPRVIADVRPRCRWLAGRRRVIAGQGRSGPLPVREDPPVGSGHAV